MSDALPSGGRALPPVKRVRKAYEQVADDMRDLILNGVLAAGQRLPTEAVLAQEFGVSRATVREALRVLATQNLVRTAKGAGGGSYVTLPTVDHISEFLSSNLRLLTESRTVSLEEFLEIRRLLEVRAARMAAERAAPAQLERLKAAIPEDPASLGVAERFEYDREFHSIIVEASGNTLLYIAVQPVFYVLQGNLERSAMRRDMHAKIRSEHETVAEAISARDPAGAEREMDSHMDTLQEVYRKIWRRDADGKANRR